MKKRMKLKTLTCVAATILIAALLNPIRLAAQEHSVQQTQRQQHHRRYKFVDLGTFGGPASATGPGALNSRGMLVGGAETAIPDLPTSNGFPCGPGGFIGHAFEWQKGVRTDLGTLPGVDKCSAVEVINERGDAAGNSETDVIDPVLGLFAIRAVLWKDGHIADLGSLGTESAAHGINNREQVVGIWINVTPDPYSFFAPFGETRAFLWEKGVINDLGTLVLTPKRST